MKNHRILVIGAGFWGKVWIEIIQTHPALDLAAVVTRTDASADAAAAAFAIDRGCCYTDLKKALDQAVADIVVVVSPAENHLEHIRAAMETGCAIICEKPLADTWDAAVEIAQVVRAHPNQKFMVAQTRRFTGPLRTIHDQIAAGRIGQVDSIAFDHRVNYTGGGWRQEMELPVLEDMISHHLDALRYITGEEPAQVYAEAWNPAWSQFTGRASNHVLATMTGGVRVTYFGTWTARGQLNSYDGLLKVMGSKGSLELVDPETLMFYPDLGREQGPSPSEQIPIDTLDHCEVDGVIEHFLQAIENGTDPSCGIEDNLKTFAFNCAVLKSCREERQVDLAEVVNQS